MGYASILLYSVINVPLYMNMQIDSFALTMCIWWSHGITLNKTMDCSKTTSSWKESLNNFTNSNEMSKVLPLTSNH